MRKLTLRFRVAAVFSVVSGAAFSANAVTVVTTFDIDDAFSASGRFDGSGSIVHQTEAGGGSYFDNIVGLTFDFDNHPGFLAPVSLTSDALTITDGGSTDFYSWVINVGSHLHVLASTTFQLDLRGAGCGLPAALRALDRAAQPVGLPRPGRR